MSDFINHECGIALVRLRKPLSYYIKKYGTPAYAMHKMYVLMEKQKNRGQDGAGIANIKIDQKPGSRYISRYRSIDSNPVGAIFDRIDRKYNKAMKLGGDKFYDDRWFKKNAAFSGELWLGHLRYGTHGKNSVETCHPIMRQNNWRSRSLVVAGNFNMTNVDELFDILVDLGQHPKDRADTVTVMEKIGHFLDEENEAIYQKYKNTHRKRGITDLIESELDLQKVLRRACKDFDGGYAMAGMTGYGAAFVARDPSGIRPAYYYGDDEVVVVASEKPAIKMALDVPYNQIREIDRGHALIINKSGDYGQYPFIDQLPKTSCSFERIYFSRGSDPDIYNERKALGRHLLPQILQSINFDLKHTVFSYIPNTAATAYMGLMEGLEDYLMQKRREVIIDGKPHIDSIDDLLSCRPRVEKLVMKDMQMRTFITDERSRDEMVAHVYDTTYEVIEKGIDTLVLIDDSIVRGTTLEKSILKMLDQLGPKKIVIASSAPQIRYPDCYGIDMSKMFEFVAFRAMVSLLKDAGKQYLLHEVRAKAAIALKTGKYFNEVNELYDLFTYEQISDKIAQIVSPDGMKAMVKVIYQTVDNLHKACPNDSGDWYFTGNFPTKGGMRVANQAFVNFMEGKLVRAY